MRALVPVLLLAVIAAAACAPREGAVSGPYVGGAGGANLREDARLR